MLSGLIWLSQKIYSSLNTSNELNYEPLPPLLSSLELQQTKPVLTNFLNVGTFLMQEQNTFFFGIFHGPPGTSLQTAKWILIQGSNPVKLKTLFKFWGEMIESYFFPFEKSVQIIPFHGKSVIIHEKKNDMFLVTLYKVKNQQLKRIRTLYVAKDLTEVTVPCLRSLFIKKSNKVVIGGVHKWLIYDLKAQYFVYQHHLIHDMVCDLAYSETLNLLFVCYVKNIVAYEWNTPFDINKVAYTISLEREDIPTIYINLYLKGNLMILKDNSKIIAWEVKKNDYCQLSEVNLSNVIPSAGLETDVIVIPEKECVLIRDSKKDVYEIGLEAPQMIKDQAQNFDAILAYNDEKEELAAIHERKFILLTKKQNTEALENSSL